MRDLTNKIMFTAMILSPFVVLAGVVFGSYPLFMSGLVELFVPCAYAAIVVLRDTWRSK